MKTLSAHEIFCRALQLAARFRQTIQSVCLHLPQSFAHFCQKISNCVRTAFSSFTILALLIPMFFIGWHNVYASQAPPAPVCEVEAQVLKVNEIEYGVGATEYLRKVAQIKVISTGKKLDPGSQPVYKDFNCEGYKDKVIDNVSIADAKLKLGQKIKGNIHYFCDEFWRGDILENIIILEDVKGN